MEEKTKETFLARWEKYFAASELPITFYYCDQPRDVEVAEPVSGHRCLIADLARVRKGESLCFSVESVGCEGGKRYLGFSQGLRPNFEYFLSCGLPGKLEGERYKKTPELVREFLKSAPGFHAPAKYILFKRWDRLEDFDHPEVVIFFAQADVLSGLFTLANFDEAEQGGVIAPFGAGCGTLVQYPYLEKDAKRPRCVLGMFDVSARPFVPGNALTFSVPMRKFLTMMENMPESFLVTSSWDKVRRRIARSAKGKS